MKDFSVGGSVNTWPFFVQYPFGASAEGIVEDIVYLLR